MRFYPTNYDEHSLRRLGLLSSAVIAGMLFGLAIAKAQSNPPEQRGFDYWQPDWMVQELWGPGRMPKGMMVRLLRHTTYMQYGVPKEYKDAKPTVKPDANTVAAGKELYAKNCARCHGPSGLGNGDATQALSPSPALLAFMIRRPISVDEYLLWSISDGGEQFGTQMPAFKDALSRDDIWNIIAYMRAGFKKGDAPPYLSETDPKK